MKSLYVIVYAALVHGCFVAASDTGQIHEMIHNTMEIRVENGTDKKVLVWIKATMQMCMYPNAGDNIEKICSQPITIAPYKTGILTQRLSTSTYNKQTWEITKLFTCERIILRSQFLDITEPNVRGWYECPIGSEALVSVVPDHIGKATIAPTLRGGTTRKGEELEPKVREKEKIYEDQKTS